MAILYATSENGGWWNRGSGRTAGSASQLFRASASTDLDTNFTRNGVLPTGTGMMQINFASQNDVWIHFTLSLGSVATSSVAVPFSVIHSATGLVVFQLDPDIGAAPWNSLVEFDLEYWNGAAFAEGFIIGGDYLPCRFVTDQLYQIDLHLVCNGASSEGTLYVDGVPRQSTNTFNPGVTGIDRIELMSNASTGSTSSPCFTEIIIATEDTRCMRVAALPPTGNSATNTAWTGAFGDVDDDNPTLTDYDHIFTGAANNVETYGMTDLSAVADNYAVLAVATMARAKVGNAGGGPLNLQHAIRQGGTNYFGSNVTDTAGNALDKQLVPTCTIWTTDPSTGLPWTVSGVNSMEVGVKSIT